MTVGVEKFCGNADSQITAEQLCNQSIPEIEANTVGH